MLTVFWRKFPESLPTLDEVGNRTQKTWTKTDLSQEASSYGYETTSNRLTLKDSKVWVTDAAGNTISVDDGQRQYTYNHANRRRTYTEDSVLKGAYYYNALGQRVRTDKVEDNLLHYDLSGQYLGETNITANGTDLQSQIDYVYLDNMPVAQIETQYGEEGQAQSRTLTYLHADHLNTPRIGTNSSETTVWRWDSDAFGQTTPNSDPDNDTNRVVVNLRFPGQIKGGEASHYYNYSRDYDPSFGRYLSSDPIGLAGGPNTYAYVGGNPVKYIDPTGLDRWDIDYANYRNRNYSAGYDFSGEGVEDPCGCGAKALGIETATGATLVASGLPVLPYPRTGVGTGSSTGATSIASRTLSSALPQRLPVRVPTPTVSNLGAGSRVLGRVLGRLVP